MGSRYSKGEGVKERRSSTVINQRPAKCQTQASHFFQLEDESKQADTLLSRVQSLQGFEKAIAGS